MRVSILLIIGSCTLVLGGCGGSRNGEQSQAANNSFATAPTTPGKDTIADQSMSDNATGNPARRDWSSLDALIGQHPLRAISSATVLSLANPPG